MTKRQKQRKHGMLKDCRCPVASNFFWIESANQLSSRVHRRTWRLKKVAISLGHWYLLIQAIRKIIINSGMAITSTVKVNSRNRITANFTRSSKTRKAVKLRSARGSWVIYSIVKIGKRRSAATIPPSWRMRTEKLVCPKSRLSSTANMAKSNLLGRHCSNWRRR